MLLFLYNLIEKSTTESQDRRNFDSVSYLSFALVLQQFTCITGKMHSFSANHKCVKFFMCIITRQSLLVLVSVCNASFLNNSILSCKREGK